jgi:hypothetical protein
VSRGILLGKLGGNDINAGEMHLCWEVYILKYSGERKYIDKPSNAAL